VIAEYVNRVGQTWCVTPTPSAVYHQSSRFGRGKRLALPGGFFFVNSGLILKADNEAELAGVMAHGSLT